MQINLYRSTQAKNEIKNDQDCDTKDFSFSNIFFNHIQFFINTGYQKKDIIILVRARKIISSIHLILKDANIDQFSFLTMTYHSLAEKIFHNYGFLRLKRKLSVVRRDEQLKMIKKICRSKNGYLNYKEILLFIEKCKSSYQNNAKKMSFSSFLKTIPTNQTRGNTNEITNSEQLHFSNQEIDNFASDIFNIYQDTLKKKNLADLDDLINFTLQIIKRNPEIISLYRRRYKFAFIDNTKQFLVRKKNINDFVSLLFINNEKRFEMSDRIERNLRYPNFQFYTLKFFSNIFKNGLKPLAYSFTSCVDSFLSDDSFAFEYNDSNQNKIFSEVSDFDIENENGVNIGVFPFGMGNNKWVQNGKDYEDDDIFTENELTQVLSDFEENEEELLSDFDFDDDDDYSEESNFTEESSESGMIHSSSGLVKNKFFILNSMKKRKMFRNNLSNEPIEYDDMENKKRERRYSYYGQNLFLKDINCKIRQFADQVGKSAFFSDDNYE